eukprot:7875830-Pyramimonas_sp.AAC.1
MGYERSPLGPASAACLVTRRVADSPQRADRIARGASPAENQRTLSRGSPGRGPPGCIAEHELFC